MEFVEARYRTKAEGTPSKDLGKAAIGSIVVKPPGEVGSFWVQTESGPMQKAQRVVIDQIPVEDVEKIEEGIDSENEEKRTEAEETFNKYVEQSDEESNVYFLNNQSYVEEERTNPNRKTRRLSTLITARRLEEHFTGETPAFTPQQRRKL
jgi:hypothetical protein